MFICQSKHFLPSSLYFSLSPSFLSFFPLTVESPTITGQPSSQLLIVPGQLASFTVTATSDKLSYQWQKNGVNIMGATSATFIVSSVVDGEEGEYRCVVRNAAGMVTSNAASLTLCK